MEKSEKQQEQLLEVLQSLQQKKKEAQEKQQMLQRDLMQVNEREWKEITLMKYLGVVPKGYKKVILPQSTASSFMPTPSK